MDERRDASMKMRVMINISTQNLISENLIDSCPSIYISEIQILTLSVFI
jgi:hypothetical protein